MGIWYNYIHYTIANIFSRKDLFYMTLKITIICVGKLKESAFSGLETEYVKRLRPYTKLKIEEIAEVSYGTEDMIPKAKEEEAKHILKRISSDAVVIALEEKGFVRDSLEFSAFLERIGSFGREIVFVIGSGVGLAQSIRERANHIISLSPLTFTHNFARVLLEEQIYRAITIMSGKPYHK